MPRVCPVKSIWDEKEVVRVLKEKHAIKLWHWLIWDAASKGGMAEGAEGSLESAPFDKWIVARDEVQAILSGDFRISTSKVVETLHSARGDSTKLLIELQDGHRIETVIMKHAKHSTVCVSSQIGCKMGCRFCATGTMGIIGDLTSGEIIEQLMHANQVTKIRNVVMMGMGEPLNNYENVKQAVLFMIDDRRFGLSPRQVTVSTVGVLKNMKRLSDEMPLVNLALSLHAPSQEIRVKIVPSASAHHIDRLLQAVDYHIQRGGNKFNLSLGVEIDDVEELEKTMASSSSSSFALKKKKLHQSGIMIEYILIQDVNDLEEHAHLLGHLLRPRREFVLLNLIPYNPTSVAEDYKPPTEESVQRFFEILKSDQYGIHTRVRGEKGQDIEGACGQLALVKPSTARSGMDIEDYGDVDRRGEKKDKPKRGGKTSTSVDNSGTQRLACVGAWLSLPFLCMSIIALRHVRSFSSIRI